VPYIVILLRQCAFKAEKFKAAQKRQDGGRFDELT
jgi:hypothetical protein